MSIERLFTYSYGVLAGADYTRRFHAALETPGPRIPLTADAALFDTMAAHGAHLLWLHTFGARFAADGAELPLDGVGWSADPTRLPADKNDVSYDTTNHELRVADGVLRGVPPEVYAFEVSGMKVIPKWLGYRMVKPPGRAASSTSPLDKIRPTKWDPSWSVELVEIVAVLRATLAKIPDGVALLDRIVTGPLVSADELPEVPAPLRQPPKKNVGKADDPDLLDGLLPGTEDELF